MKRKILTAVLTAVAAVSCALGLAACSKNNNKWNGVYSVEDAYAIAVEMGYTDSLDEFIKAISGSDGADGKDGNDGKNGTGITDAYVDGDGYLIIQLSDGTKKNCGQVVFKSEEGSEGLFYSEIKEDGKVTGYTVRSLGSSSETDIVIPSQYKGKPVVSIGESAFYNCIYINSVTIPDSVQTVGNSAFGQCVNLKKAVIGNGVTQIGENAFNGCNSLESVALGVAVEAIGASAFAHCTAIESLYVNDIASWCNISFANTSANPMYFAHGLYVGGKLAESIVIPDGVAQIPAYAFYECENITDVRIGGVAAIGENAFYNCANLESAVIGGVEVIGGMAFADCAQLVSVTFGNKLKSIEGYAFHQCEALEEITLPPSVESIGESAFTSCSNLKRINLNEGLKSIGDCAFGGCVSLEKFVMPDSVTSIGFGILMFGGGGGFVPVPDMQNSLSELVMSNNITEIPDFAFSQCTVSTVTIGEKVQTVNYSAFYGCSMLESVVIPASVTKIVSYAFYKCPMLQKVYYLGTAEQWSNLSRNTGGGNDIKNATVYYYSQSEPAEDGNYWTYGENGEIKVW